MGAPPLSVVMPARNALPYLDEAVESVLAQSFGDFELVIGDDGSSDGTSEALAEWARRDARIRVLRREGRSGHAGVGNWVVAEARAPIVARMDADDRAYPDRLERQMALLAAEPEVDLVGTAFDTIDGSGKYIRPVDYWRLKRQSVFAPFCHSSAMFRRSAFERAGGYRVEADAWEDLDLFLRIARDGRIAMLPEVLTTLRHAEISDRLKVGEDNIAETFDRMYRCVEAYRNGGDYEAVLHAPERHERLHPMAFVALGSVRLWSGAAPDMLRLIRRRGDLRFDLRSAKLLAWATWGELSPGSLRAVLRLLLTMRNAGARRGLEGQSYIEWRPEGLRA
jgi:glycosyltransferase involved in cell wall biosynthesis